MTPRVFYHPPNPPARRAATLLVALGGLALLLGGVFLVSGSNFATLAQNPDFKERMDEVRRQTGVEPVTAFIGFGVLLLTYALPALVLGLLARGGGQVVLILTLVFASGVTLLTALIGLASVAQGDVSGVLLFGFLCGLHALAASWLIRALARPVTSPFAVAGPRVPLQEYYLPPVEPAVDANRYGPGVAR